MPEARAAAPPPSIARRAAFDFVRYANVWEDAEVLCAALAPVARGGRLLSIASAGDNALALLTLDPAEVVAVDLSGPQLACAALRAAALRRLERPELLAFLGVEPAADRAAVYRGLRAELPEAARAFWDARPEAIAGGVIHAGKFERYFHLFRRRLLPLVPSRAAVDALFAARDREERRAVYGRRWDTWRWRAVFNLFFSRAVMGRHGRDPEFFAQVEGPVGPRILERTRWALTELPAATNPYFTYIVTGNFAPRALPMYLMAEHHPVIRARLDRLRLVEGPAEAAGPGPFAGMNLSDIFEYMGRPEFERCYAALVSRAAPGARLVYWNMLAPRGRPAAEAARARPLEELARELHARDRAWFYQRLHVDEVVDGSAGGAVDGAGAACAAAVPAAGGAPAGGSP